MSDNLDSGIDDALPLDDGAQALLDGATADVIDVGPQPNDGDDRPASQRPFDAGRDAGGRFVARDVTPSGDARPPEPEKPATLKEVQEFLAQKERADRAERDAQDLRGRLAQFERPAGPAADPLDDPHLMFSDPAAYQAAMLAKVTSTITETRDSLRREAINADMDQTARQHPELKEAWPRFVEACKRDPSLKAQFDALPTYGRGQEVLTWDKRNRALSAIPDGDLSKYEETLLKDPAFLARAAEAMRGQGAGLPAPAPRTTGNVTRLPSASRAGSAAVAALPADLSDQDLLDSITGSR